MAESYNNLAILYFGMQNIKESEQMYKLALEIYKGLAEKNRKVYEPVLMVIYNNFGALYNNIQRFDMAEQMYKSSLVICKRLVDTNSQIYEPDLANIYNNLAL